MFKLRVMVLGLMVALGASGTAGERVPASVAPLLEKAIEAHGGAALEQLQTYRETYEMNATVLGIGVYNVRAEATVDFTGQQGKLEFYRNGTLESVYGTSPKGALLWQPKGGTKKLNIPRRAEDDYLLVTPMKSSVLGLLAMGNVAEKLEAKPEFTIEGRKGSAIKRTGNGYEITYLFGADGTIIAEHSIYPGANPQEKFAVTLLYTKYKTVGGIKFPVSADVISSAIPGIARANLQVRDVAVNPTLDKDAFKMP